MKALDYIALMLATVLLISLFTSVKTINTQLKVEVTND